MPNMLSNTRQIVGRGENATQEIIPQACSHLNHKKKSDILIS